jgi:hypothetical protein
MRHRRSWLPYALGIAIASTAWSDRARAYDSAGATLSANKTYSPPAYVPPTTQAAADPFAAQACYPTQYPTPESRTCSTPNAVASNQFDFVTKTFHFATPNATGTPTDTNAAESGLFKCPRTSSVEPPTDLSSLTQCQAIPWNEANPDGSLVTDGKTGWEFVRRAWSTQPTNPVWSAYHSPEHMLITLQAAMLAGFPVPSGTSSGTSTNPMFTQVFWSRYPVLDQYVASPWTQDAYVVGQTMQPVSFANVGAHSTRGIFLPELAQLPDQSYSVWDWAAGNEVCPIQGLDAPNGLNVFSSQGSTLYDVNNCHDFARLMGPLNANHFKPGNQAFYVWYHQRAINRMHECSALQNALSTLPQDTLQGIDPQATYSTEAHECEREAMVYEMFAQHFLQDNWSTGHMWARWGSPDLSSMPTSLSPAAWPMLAEATGMTPSVWALTFPNENLLARRQLTAGILSMMAGTIHGTKAVSQGQVGQAGNDIGLADDPLCGPNYPNFLNLFSGADSLTSWSLQGASLALPTGPDGIAPGAGDYYWNPPGSLGKVSILADDASKDYQFQRDHLLACAANSIRQVYLAGPGAHGKLNDPGTVDTLSITSVDPTGADCWGNWATNASMYGALSPIFASRKWFGTGLQNLLNGATALFDQVLASKYITSTGEVTSLPYSQYDPAWLQDLSTLLSEQVGEDTLGLEAQFAFSALTNGSGTDSAQLTSPGGPLTMLGVLPNSNVGDPSPTGAPAYYADVDSPRGPETQYPNDYVVRRMFWRSHLRETCAEVDAGTLYGLRTRCMQSAAHGGDPEACTACVEAAEPQIPTCGEVTFDPSADQWVTRLGYSKCEALTGSTNASLPPEWSDTSFATTQNPIARWQMIAQTTPVCVPPDLEAVEFCTGTQGSTDALALVGDTQVYSGGPLLADPADVVVLNATNSTSVSSQCPPPPVCDGNPSTPLMLATTSYNVALVHTEGVGGPGPTPLTIVTAFQVTRQESDGKITPYTLIEPCGAGQPPEQFDGFQCTMAVTYTSTAPMLDSPLPAIAGAQLAANDVQSMMYLFPYAGGPFDQGLGFCGSSQRFSLWDRSCNDVLTTFALGVSPTIPSDVSGDRASLGYGRADNAFGWPDGSSQARCAVVEPRTPYSRTCKSGQFVCNSADLCVPDPGTPPKINYLSWW